MLLFIMVPAAAGLLALAGPIVRMIFEWGQFTAAHTDYTRIALQCYAPGLIVFSLAKVLVPAFYAGQDTRTPVKVGVLCMVLNLVLNVAFILTWPQPIKHAGLACATVISEGVYALILAALIHRRLGSPGWGRIGVGFLKAAVAATGMALLVGAASRLLPGWFAGLPLPAKIEQILSVFAAMALGIVAYLLAACILRARELREVLGVLKRKRA
jgi:putative peptidoglycan lipid II flippase